MVSRPVPAPAALALVVCFAAVAVSGSQGTSPSTRAIAQEPAPESAVLADSEMAVVESGGIAGRVHSVRLAAANGRIHVVYRAPEARAGTAPFTGTLDARRYLTLWRGLEAAGVWTIRSAAPSRGADLIQIEVRLRLGDAAHVVRWDEGAERTKQLQELVEIGQRALAAGREAAFSQ